MKIRRRNAVSVIFLTGLSLMSVAGICAQPVPQVTVSFADLNLSNPQGVATLYRRLQRAAAEVCGSEPHVREFTQRSAWSGCASKALDNAVVQVHSAELTALHAKRGGQRTAPLMARTTMEAH
jgi:UrcA family protein